MEVSAKDGKNVTEMFEKLGERVNEYVKNTRDATTGKDEAKRISLHNAADQQVNEGGCKC